MSITLQVTKQEVEELLEKLYSVRDSSERELRIASESAKEERERMIEECQKSINETRNQLEIDSNNYLDITYQEFRKEVMDKEEVRLRELVKSKFFGWYKTEEKLKVLLEEVEDDYFEVPDTVCFPISGVVDIESKMRWVISCRLLNMYPRPTYRGVTAEDYLNECKKLDEWLGKEIPSPYNSEVRGMISSIEEIKTAASIDRHLLIEGETSKDYIRATEAVKRFNEELK